MGRLSTIRLATCDAFVICTNCRRAAHRLPSGFRQDVPHHSRPLARDVSHMVSVSRLILRGDQTEICPHTLAVRKTMRVVQKGYDCLGGTRTHAGNALQLSDGRVVFGESRQFLLDVPQLNRQSLDFLNQQIPLQCMHRLREFQLLQLRNSIASPGRRGAWINTVRNNARTPFLARVRLWTSFCRKPISSRQARTSAEGTCTVRTWSMYIVSPAARRE